ncbi:hypothetical protein HN587_04010 [Candidatus Woesearchaeota archaeon]|jgi:hypothetical protein|nr:hypothetical protein [Candidatus Woesearchaeota archaeon]
MSNLTDRAQTFVCKRVMSFLLILVLLICFSSFVLGVAYCDVEGQVFYNDSSSVGVGKTIAATVNEGDFNGTTLSTITQVGGPSCDYCDNYYSISYVGTTQCMGGELFSVGTELTNFQAEAQGYLIEDSVVMVDIYLSVNESSPTPPEPSPGPGGPGGPGGGGDPIPDPDPETIPPVDAPEIPLPKPEPESSEEQVDEWCVMEGYVFYSNGSRVGNKESVDVKIGSEIIKVITQKGPPPNFFSGYFSAHFSECMYGKEIILEAESDGWKGSNSYLYSAGIGEMTLVLDKEAEKERIEEIIVVEIPKHVEVRQAEIIMTWIMAFVAFVLTLTAMWLSTRPGNEKPQDPFFTFQQVEYKVNEDKYGDILNREIDLETNKTNMFKSKFWLRLIKKKVYEEHYSQAELDKSVEQNEDLLKNVEVVKRTKIKADSKKRVAKQKIPKKTVRSIDDFLEKYDPKK